MSNFKQSLHPSGVDKSAARGHRRLRGVVLAYYSSLFTPIITLPLFNERAVATGVLLFKQMQK